MFLVWTIFADESFCWKWESEFSIFMKHGLYQLIQRGKNEKSESVVHAIVWRTGPIEIRRPSPHVGLPGFLIPCRDSQQCGSIPWQGAHKLANFIEFSLRLVGVERQLVSLSQRKQFCSYQWENWELFRRTGCLHGRSVSKGWLRVWGYKVLWIPDRACSCAPQAPTYAVTINGNTPRPNSFHSEVSRL